jgi:hypothetical protein
VRGVDGSPEFIRRIFSPTILVGKVLSVYPNVIKGMRQRMNRLRRQLRSDELSVVATIGTVLLVAITVAMMVVVGMWMFTLVQIPEDPPDIKVNFSQLNERWTVSITKSRDEVRLNTLRIVARDAAGEFIMYDSDGDGVVDKLMVADLEEIAVSSADGPQGTPIVFVDADGDDRLGVGDSIVVYEDFFFPVGPLMDMDRAFAFVGPSPDQLPLDSNLKVLASRTTLSNPDIDPGDTIQVDIRQGATLMATVSGPASASGTFMDDLFVPIAWGINGFSATFTVRPGEIDEWSQVHTFRTKGADPITPAEREVFDAAVHPFDVADVIGLIHEPTQTTVVEFRL